MILAIDTATRTISLALRDEHEIVAEQTWRSPDHHTTELSPHIDAMLKRARIAAADLAVIGVSLGPGSFTGLRIGLSVAKGLALAQPHLALVGVPTLDIVAAAQPHPEGVVQLCAVVQAGRGRVSAGFYQHEGGAWQAAGAPFIATWQDLINRLSRLTLVAGEIDPAGRAALGEHLKQVVVADPAGSLRRAGFLAEIAYRRWRAGQVDDPAGLAPVYLH